MNITTFLDLVELLQQENIPHKADAGEQLVEVTVRSGPLETEMVIRWEAALVLAQFIVAFPYKVPPERVALVEHALALSNHRLIMPGFGLDNAARLLYYRLVVPRGEDGSLSADYVQRLIATAVDTMIDFFEYFLKVLRDGADPDALLTEMAPRLAMPAAVRSAAPQQPPEPGPAPAKA